MVRYAIFIVIVVSLAILVAACQPVTQPAPNPDSALVPLEGTQWLLDQMQGEHLIHDATVTATFGDDGTLQGRAGCNDYATSYETDGGNIVIDPSFDAGDNVCGEAIMAVESLYLASLQRARSYELEGEVMFIRDDEGAVMLVYDADTD